MKKYLSIALMSVYGSYALAAVDHTATKDAILAELTGISTTFGLIFAGFIAVWATIKFTPKILAFAGRFLRSL